MKNPWHNERRHTQYNCVLHKHTQKELLGFSPPANYIDRATAACRRS
jgi:hypothetical protein